MKTGVKSGTAYARFTVSTEEWRRGLAEMVRQMEERGIAVPPGFLNVPEYREGGVATRPL